MVLGDLRTDNMYLVERSDEVEVWNEMYMKSYNYFLLELDDNDLVIRVYGFYGMTLESAVYLVYDHENVCDYVCV